MAISANHIRFNSKFYLICMMKRFRLKERLGCEPSEEQLANSLKITRANLQAKRIECSLAREKLAMSNVRLVMSIAQRYDNMGAEMSDLIQVSILFDTTSGLETLTKFTCKKLNVIPNDFHSYHVGWSDWITSRD